MISLEGHWSFLCVIFEQDHTPSITHISKLNQAQLSQLTDTVVGRARLKEELHQAHLLTAKHGPHCYLYSTEGDKSTLIFTSVSKVLQFTEECEIRLR